MDDKLKVDISKIVDESLSSHLSNQQVTLTSNLENIDVEDRLWTSMIWLCGISVSS